MRQFLVLFMLVVFAACSGGGSNEPSKAQRFTAFMNSQDGNNYQLVKGTTKVPGYIVLHDQNTGEFVAFNINNWEDGVEGQTPASWLAGVGEGTVVRDLEQQLEYYIDYETVITYESVWVEGYYEEDEWIPGHYEDGDWVPGYYEQGDWVSGYYTDGDWVPGYYDMYGDWIEGYYEEGEWVEGYYEEIYVDGYYEQDWVPGYTDYGDYIPGYYDQIPVETIVPVERSRNIYVGGGYIFQQGGTFMKDLELLGALVEKQEVNALGEALAADYGLSESRGIEVARVLKDMNELQTKRSLTNTDKSAFSNEILGVDFPALEKAIKDKNEGKTEPLDALLQKAADTNETSPENMRSIFNKLLNE